jgi:hypothetical protein
MAIAAHLGKEAQLGYAIGARLEFIVIPLAFVFGTALVAMVGTNWGAGHIRARGACLDRWVVTGALRGRGRCRRDLPGGLDAALHRGGKRHRGRLAIPADRGTRLRALRLRAGALFLQPGLRQSTAGGPRERRPSRAEAAGGSLAVFWLGLGPAGLFAAIARASSCTRP